MAPSANNALNQVGPNPPYAPQIPTGSGADFHHSRYPRESPCILYGIPIDEKATVAELRTLLEHAVNKRSGLSVLEEIPEEVAESGMKVGERVRKEDAAVRGVASAGGKDASVKGSASGSAKEGGKGKGKKLAEKDRDVLKVVKSGPKVGKKAVKKVITKTVVPKTVKVSKKKAPKTEAAPLPPPPPQESLDVDPYEGEPMMWPIEMDIEESHS
ncbi:hypothetical protein C7212DRAFT_359409 [Tuber magnatum]|uniref:Uncharacterized protein n=1 Tax=Tuber magnatum TaxID=42249 RepID=A0A317SJ79_9PEZI|nr:hypothetical protein C7212DRAFT_359409 [Tuber magnatum]